MDFGSAWPSQADSSGSRACTFPPSRYQSSMVATVNVCRLWGIPHKIPWAFGPPAVMKLGAGVTVGGH